MGISSSTSIMAVLLIFGFFVVLTAAHNITNLIVPQYGDPRREARLECHFASDRGDPPLHSVKWYRDYNEIFRFTPDQQPSIRIFNTTGTSTKGACTMHNCTISVALPTRYNTRVLFTCEVSTEGPRFAVVKQSKNLTVAVALPEDPVISGLPTSVQLGEDVLLNCSTGYAMPPANIAWFIDGRPERVEPWMSDNTEVSNPDHDGLRASWRPLRIKVASTRGAVSVRCEATQPTRPPNVRATTATITVARSPHLSMFTASGSSLTQASALLGCTVIYIISKYSALSDV